MGWLTEILAPGWGGSRFPGDLHTGPPCLLMYDGQGLVQAHHPRKQTASLGWEASISISTDVGVTAELALWLCPP